MIWNVDDTFRSDADAYQRAFFQVTDADGQDSIDYVAIRFGDENTVVLREGGQTIENNSSSDDYFTTYYKHSSSSPDSRPIDALVTVTDNQGETVTKTFTMVKPDLTPLGSETFIYTQDYSGDDINGVAALKRPSLSAATLNVSSVYFAGINTNDLYADEIYFWFYDILGNYVGYYHIGSGEFVNNANFDHTAVESEMHFSSSYTISDIDSVYPETYSAPWNDGSHFQHNSPYIATGAKVDL